MIKKEAVIIISLLLIIPLVSAGFFDFIKNPITGKATSQPTNISVGVVGTNPVQITQVGPIAAVNPTELSTTTIAFEIHMYDPDGVADINDTSVNATFTKSGETSKTTGNSGTCTFVADLDSYTANYSCSIDMWYFDGSGSWTISAQGKDVGNSTWIVNNSATFTYNELKAMVISPGALTFPSVSPGGINQTSNNDPTLINNTGNYNGTIDVTAIDLYGESDSSYWIYAENFTSGLTEGTAICLSGTSLVNATATEITSSISNRGNLSSGSGAGQEEIYYCIPKVPEIVSQTYSTEGGGSWTIAY